MHSGVTCPFCGLLCDDLVVEAAGERLEIRENGCPISRPEFSRPLENVTPSLRATPATLEAAIDHAASLLRNARHPLFAGLATDVAGTRAALQIADRLGAAVDYVGSRYSIPNIRVLQESGWVTTTFSEVRNRADLLLILANRVDREFPRFYERLVWNHPALFVAETRKRRVFLIGSGPEPGSIPTDVSVAELHWDLAELGDIASALRALLRGEEISAAQVGGASIAELQHLVDALRQARYGVVVWAPGQFDFPHAELGIQTLCEFIKDLNQETRCVGLPLAGRGGSQTASLVMTWQTSYPGRIDFSRGYPVYDPLDGGTERLIAEREVDVLVWVDAFDASVAPPATSLPSVVLGRAGMKFDSPPDVFVPLGTPGLDHSGHAFRCDSVVSLPLRKLRPTRLPSAAEVLTRIGEAL